MDKGKTGCSTSHNKREIREEFLINHSRDKSTLAMFLLIGAEVTRLLYIYQPQPSWQLLHVGWWQKASSKLIHPWGNKIMLVMKITLPKLMNTSNDFSNICQGAKISAGYNKMTKKCECHPVDTANLNVWHSGTLHNRRSQSNGNYLQNWTHAYIICLHYLINWKKHRKKSSWLSDK